MTYQFDPNKYKNTFDSMFGKGKFDSGVAQAKQAAIAKVQASFAQKDYLSRLQAAKEAALHKTYQDAVDYWSQPENKKYLQQNGVYKVAQNFKNDPQMQEEAKKAGFNQQDYIDAMYAAASAGQKQTFRSEREYNQYSNSLAKQKKAEAKAADQKSMAEHGMNLADWTNFQAKQKKQSTNNNSNGLSGFINGLKNLGGNIVSGVKDIGSEIGTAAKAAEQFINPFDNVSADQAVKNYINHKQSNTFKEVSRGANRAVDSASLGLMSNLDKKLNNRTPYYNSVRQLGKGGGTDMITSGLGFLVPGIGAAKAVKAVGLGAKEATGLVKLSKIAKEGAITGGALTGAQTGINYAINPKDQNLKQNLTNIGLGVGLGAVADPLLYGLGHVASNGLMKFAKGEVPTFTGKPSSSVIDAMKPKSSPSEQLQNSLKSFRNAEQKPLNANISNLPLNPTKGIENIKPFAGFEPKKSANKAFEAISQVPKGKGNDITSPQDPHGYGLIDITAQPNKFDAPYHPGDPLPDTRSQIGTKAQRTIPTMSDLANKGTIKMVDNLHRLNQFDQQVKNVLGRDLKPSESTHMLGLNSRGSDMISKQILTQNMVDKNGNAIGKSLKDITMQVPKGKLKDFEDYLINKHAITRMQRGEKVFPDAMNMSTAKSEAIVKNYDQKYPQFQDLAKQYYNYNNQLGQKWLVDTGILSKDQWEGYLKSNPHYVPNNRVFSNIEKPSFGNLAKKGFANQTNPVKAATGSQRQIVSPIESTIEHTAQYVKTAKRNEVMQTLINSIQNNPETFKGWAEIVPTDKTPQSVLDTLNKNGVNGVLETLNQGFKQKPDLTKGNIVRGLIDGKPVHVKVNDPELLDALTNLTPKAQNVIINAAGQVTRIMKNLTTGINPVFSLTRNIFRDIPTAYVNSKSTNNPITFSKDLVGSVISVMKNDNLYRSFKAVGGGHSSPISTDVNLLAQSKRSILPKEPGLINNARNIAGKGLGALENLNNAVEAAPRLAEFKRLAGNTYDSKMNALYNANDVTVNFNKYGNTAKEIDSLVPYFNAAVQGLDKLWRTFISPTASKAEKTAATVKAFTGITIPSILMFAVNHNNPDYQKVSNYIKDTNILVPKGDGTFFKIPKPRELGILFGSDVERVLRSWSDSDPKAFQDFSTSILESFLPPYRTTFAPISDLRANKNFMNAPIIPADLQNLPPAYQYDGKTSEIGKTIGKLFNVSPMKTDYLIKSYGGILGELGLPLATKNTTVGNALMQKVSVDPVFSNDIQRRFYDAKTKLDQAHNALTKQGSITSDLNEAARKQLNGANTTMSRLRKIMKKAQNDTSLTPEQRLQQVRQYQDYINQVALQAMQNVR